MRSESKRYAATDSQFGSVCWLRLALSALQLGGSSAGGSDLVTTVTWLVEVIVGRE